MIARRVTSFAIPGLSAVFVPDGLPLLEKFTGTSPTTSVLVRGEAGTGKTFLALAIAHTIARELGGYVYFLSLEALPKDAKYKASVLKIAHKAISTLGQSESEPTSHSAGDLVLSHLSWLSKTDISAIGDRERAAFDVVSDAVLSTNASGVPMRALVIDGFATHESAEDPKIPRTDLANLLAVLESKGISPIIVEEATPESDKHLMFLVDCVFETRQKEFAPGWPTHPVPFISQQLIVRKSRYSANNPGPHKFTLTRGEVAIDIPMSQLPDTSAPTHPRP